ncbi:thioredoxin family protein [Desulfonatronovibrio magnus]|uniref:thioredoxin family protein n=1 Tax=Desulfonatronovibrio magnus TaxID=698827 RepID=UPI000696B414|nr:thioredoxin family protein [Desulfonatronovibrio magnus]
MKKFAAVIVFLGAVFTLMFMYTAQQQKQEQALRATLPDVPAQGMITFINLGTASCLPCQMMDPILEELQEVYVDQVKIAFIDIGRHADQSQRFRITSIPTQIFFDHRGEEFFRHQGYMDKASIVNVLEDLLSRQNTMTDSGSMSPQT